MAWAWLEKLRGEVATAVSPAPAEPDHVQALVDKVVGLMKSEPLIWTSLLRTLSYKPSVIEEPLIVVNDCKDDVGVNLEILRHDGKKETIDKLSLKQKAQLVAACKDLDDWILQAKAEALVKNIDSYRASVDIAEAVGSHEYPHSAAAKRGK